MRGNSDESSCVHCPQPRSALDSPTRLQRSAIFAARRSAFQPAQAGGISVLILLCALCAAPAAAAQATTSRAIPGMLAMDSLVAAEFARDSVGSITAAIVSGNDLVWTKSSMSVR